MKEDGKQLLSALTFHEKSLKYEYVWKLFLKHKYRLDYQVCLKFDVVESLFINFGVVDIGNYFKLIEYAADNFTILYTSEVPRAFYFTLLWIPDFCNFPRIFILNIAYLPISKLMVVLLIHTNKKALRNKDFSDEIQWLNEIYMIP